jgi:hypothetical protein
MNIQIQLQLDNYLLMLLTIPDRILLRFILITLIDGYILYDDLNNDEQVDVINLRNDAYNRILDPNAKWLLDSIMEIVVNATHAQRIHIFNRIVNMFRNPNIAG